MSSTEPFTVMVSPSKDDEGRSFNPFTELLYNQLELLDVRVVNFDLKGNDLLEPQVLHVQWPEQLLDQRIGFGRTSYVHVAIRTIKLMRSIRTARRRGLKIVWTAHNIAPHSVRLPFAYRIFFAFFSRNLDAVITLSEASTLPLKTAHPQLRKTPFYTIPHGHYRGVYGPPVDRHSARQQLGIEPDETVFLCFGLVRRYKNHLALVQEFVGRPGSGQRLIIAGAVLNDPELLSELEAATRGDDRVQLMLTRIVDDMVPILHAAADAVILPYHAPSILNSGAAILSLSLDRPVVAPMTSSLTELRAQVGPQWLATFDNGPASALDEAVDLISLVRSGTPNLDPNEWTGVGAATVAAYRSIAKL